MDGANTRPAISAYEESITKVDCICCSASVNIGYAVMAWNEGLLTEPLYGVAQDQPLPRWHV